MTTEDTWEDVDLLQMVMDGMRWEKSKAQMWFNVPNPLLGGATPNGFELLRGKGKLVKFIQQHLEENKRALMEKK